MKGSSMEIQDVPPGCMEIPGFIIPIHSDPPAWLTLEGNVTHLWQERGVWETPELANEAINKFCR